ncbi:MAG: transposase [Candidatus Nanopelagicales bacterium]
METDPTRICQLLVGLPEVHVLGVEAPDDGTPLVVHVSCPDGWQQQCPRCAVRGWVKQRTVVRLTDLPAFGRPTVLAWHKIRRTCPNDACVQGSWTTHDDRIASARHGVTHRAGRWLTEQVGRYRRAVAVVAAELGCDWHTVNDTVLGYGQVLVDDPARIGPVTALGMDETLFARQGHYRTQRWATTFADVAGHRLIDITEGKDSDAVIGWLEQRPQTWLEAIEVGALDMASSYRSIYHRVLPQATLVVDPFHLIKHANLTLDRTRCAVQNQTLDTADTNTIRSTGPAGYSPAPTSDSTRTDSRNCRGCWPPATPTGTSPPPGPRRKPSAGSTPNPPRPPRTTCTPCPRIYASPTAMSTSAAWAEPCATGPARSWPGTPHGPPTDPPKRQNNLIKAVKRTGFGFRTFRNYRIRVLLQAGGVNWNLLPTMTPR